MPAPTHLQVTDITPTCDPDHRSPNESPVSKIIAFFLAQGARI